MHSFYYFECIKASDDETRRTTGGHNILGAGRVTTTGDVQAGTTVSAGSDVQAGNNVLAANDVTGGGNLRIGGTSQLMGNVGVGHVAPSNDPNIRLAVDKRAEVGSVLNTDPAAGGTSCGQYKPDAQATGADGRLYVCRNGQWAAASGWDGPRMVNAGSPKDLAGRCTSSFGAAWAQNITACVDMNGDVYWSGPLPMGPGSVTFYPGVWDTQASTWSRMPTVTACYNYPSATGTLQGCGNIN